MTHTYFDFVEARQNMVENQLRPAEVNHVKLIEIMRILPREECVLENQKEVAYSDINIPLNDNRFLSEPRVSARLIQLAEINNQQKILVIGAGTGYLAVIIRLLGADVYALEENKKLAEIGEKFSNNYTSGIHWHNGKLYKGLEEYKFFDTIIIDGCIKNIPKLIVDQLEKNGHIITVLKKNKKIGYAVKATKTVSGLAIQPKFYAALPYLYEFIK